MSIFKSVSLATTVFLLSLASVANATSVLTTAPALYTFAGDDMWCDMINVGKKPITATFEAVGYDGVVVATRGPELIDPAHGDALQVSTGAAYCRFTVSTSVKGVRAVATYSKSGSYTMSIPAQ